MCCFQSSSANQFISHPPPDVISFCPVPFLGCLLFFCQPPKLWCFQASYLQPPYFLISYALSLWVLSSTPQTSDIATDGPELNSRSFNFPIMQWYKSNKDSVENLTANFESWPLPGQALCSIILCCHVEQGRPPRLLVSPKITRWNSPHSATYQLLNYNRP